MTLVDDLLAVLDKACRVRVEQSGSWGGVNVSISGVFALIRAVEDLQKKRPELFVEKGAGGSAAGEGPLANGEHAPSGAAAPPRFAGRVGGGRDG